MKSALAIGLLLILITPVHAQDEVLLVDGDRHTEKWQSETDFLRIVLELEERERRQFAPKVQPASALPRLRLSDYRLVVLSNVASIAPRVRAALERYVRKGGALVITLGDKVDRKAYNAQLWRGGAGVLPAKLIGQHGGERARAVGTWRMALGSATGSRTIRAFQAKDLRPMLGRCELFGFLKSEPGRSRTRVRLWAAPERGGKRWPLVVERRFGSGRVVLWTSSVDPSWNDCVLWDGFYVVFWRLLAKELTARKRVWGPI